MLPVPYTMSFSLTVFSNTPWLLTEVLHIEWSGLGGLIHTCARGHQFRKQLYQSDFLGSFLISGESLWDYGMFIEFSDPMPILGISATEHLQACASAATLTINARQVALGDAIVCWRACVVWHKNRVVRAVCGLFLLATSSLAVVNATQSCRPSQPFVTADGPNSLNFPGTLFEGLPLGIAACVLSLSTNLLATLLVAYKAWESRRRLGGYLVAKIGGSQVEKLLALLVESGAMYSAIWAVVVAYGVIMNGVLVPAIAIYPTIIIVLVALDRSHMERGLTQHLESLPTPNLALTVNSTATIPHENRLYRGPEVLVIDGQELRRGDILESEDASRRTSEERKGEGLSTAELLRRMSKGYIGETCA
ncbi:hypothetical protein LXA43DRAFT_1080150 [Ganoderma leucocontextum]|nr:hypothetical protein LXA43DRAFT_1080150 [Ganoderma leucocontextum]